MLNGLDLFSGIGGLTIALSPWVKPIAYCENDRYAMGVLLSRMFKGDIPTAPICDDIKTLHREDLEPIEIDIIYGGFPCQDVSCAGARKGLDGERTGLFREAIRLVRECEPKFVFLENVPGIRKYVPTVREELEALGYDCRDGFLSAAECGANHIRNRWWLLGYANSNGESVSSINDEMAKLQEDATNSNSKRRRDKQEFFIESEDSTKLGNHSTKNSNWWSIEPEVGRVANGVPARVDRIRGLGNAVVPQCAREAFRILMGITPSPGGVEL